MHTSATQAATAPFAAAEAFERHAVAHGAVASVNPALAAEPDLLAAVDEATARLDADALPGEAASAMEALDAVRSALSRLHPRPDEWDLPSAADAAAAVVAALRGLPDRDALAQASVASREASEQRGVVMALEGEMDRLAGPAGAGREERVARAAAAVRSLRSAQGMASLADADAALSRLVDERSSLSRLADAWRDLAHSIAMPAEALDPAEARGVVEQVVALGIEGLLQVQALPEDALAVVEAFEAERDGVQASLARLSHLGDAWATEPPARLRRAAEIVAAGASDLPTVLQYLGGLGLDGMAPADVAALARLRERRDAVEADVASARVIGPAFAGMSTDASPLRDRLERWAWVSVPGNAGPAGDAIRQVLGGRGVLAKARLLETAGRVLGVTAAHEEEFGTGWEGRPAEQARIEALTVLVADVEAMRAFEGGAARVGAYQAVFKAAAVAGRLRSEREALEDLARSGSANAMAAEVDAAMATAAGALSAVGHGAALAADPWEVRAAAAAVEAAVPPARGRVRAVAAAAGFDFMDGASTLSEASSRLSLAGACADRARAVTALAAARAELEELGQGPTVATLERAGTPPVEWGRKHRGLVAVQGSRHDGDVRHVRGDAGRGPILFAVSSATHPAAPSPRQPDQHETSPSRTEAGAQVWEEESFPAYATRGGRRAEDF